MSRTRFRVNYNLFFIYWPLQLKVWKLYDVIILMQFDNEVNLSDTTNGQATLE